MSLIGSVAAICSSSVRKLTSRLGGQEDIGAVLMGAAQVFIIRTGGAGLAYISMIVMARWLGTFDFGVYAYVWVWVGILGLAFSLGYSSSALRFLPDYFARGKWQRLHGFLRQSNAVIIGASVLCSLLGAGVLALLRGSVETYYFYPLLVGLLCVPIFALVNQFESIGRAFGWVHLAYVPSYIVRPVLLMAFIGAMILIGMHPTAVDALLAMTVACVVGALIQGVLIYSGIRGHVPPTPATYHTRHWSVISLTFVMIDGFHMLLDNADVLMVGRLLDPKSVAVYFAAIRTGNLIAFIYFAVSALAVPRFSKIHITGTREEMQSFVKGVIHLMFWPSLLTAFALAGVGYFALSLFGADFALGYPVLLVVLTGLVIKSATGPVEYLLNMTGHHKDTLRVYGLTAVADIGLNLLLIPRFGIVGAAISTYLAVAGANVWLYMLVRRRLGVSAFILSFKRKPSPPAVA